ncbi:acyl-CoA carboxylase epsilon subunit [Cellulomonas marina]|uniref:Acyl-CoA carboxylase epsilon subunit n=1 Tax=Cellulomonas marina TaxID=988821 RepID=A0A1I0ZK08_9CELL|nr:acyl-CoA carboxylase epsilon subunit [Cellulomonas marina]GIG28661.1 hypothetical protein Cma02nite_12610 [Cellulomonas marina]SFB25985.1 Acyl-CoA carboxylase epsilon subunit [Cellulomonas marina]
MSAPTDDRPPHVQVVRGEPDDVELAALVAGLVAAAGPGTGAGAGPGAGGGTGHGHDDGPAPSAWCDRARSVRGTVAPAAGADAWRWSLRG